VAPVVPYNSISTIEVPCPICRRSYTEGDLTYSVRDFLNAGSQQAFDYVNCACGVFFLKSQPTSEDLPKIYSSEYEAYKKKSGVVSQLKNQRFINMVKPYMLHGANTKVLDFGCGSGDFLVSLSPLTQSKLVGFDINPPNRSSNEVIFLGREDEIKLHGPFDLIVSFQVIEHLPDPLTFLKNLDSLLAEGGIIVIETPSPSGLLFTEFFRKRWGGWHAPRHFVLFTKNTMEKLCADAGFYIKEFSYIPSPFQWIETIRTFVPINSKLNQIISLDNFFLVAISYLIDVTLIKLGRKSSNMRLVLRRN